MSEKILFRETQRFRQWWILAIIIGMNGFFLLAAYFQFILKQPFGDKPMDNISLLITFTINLMISVLFFLFRLETSITKNQISVRFFPFHLKPIVFTHDQIKTLFVREYKPIREYGGWGLKGSPSNKAYNVSGNIGLQLVLNDGNKILIGTRERNKMQEIVDLFNRPNE